MAGLVSRSWKESYKSVIIIEGASDGAGATHRQLTDGAGVTIPLFVASGSLRIDSGKKFYFSDTDLNNYIFNSGTNVMNFVAGTRIVVSPRLHVSGTMSAATIVGGTADITAIIGSTASFKGTVKTPTVSATTIKGTTVNVTTVSATTIKGGVQTPKGGTFTVASGTVKFALSPEYSIGLAADNKTVAIKANNVAALNVQATKVIPGVAGIDMGANNAASRWNNIYGASGYYKNLTVSTITVKAGSVSVTTLKARFATANNLYAVSNIGLYTGAYFDEEKQTQVKGGTSGLLMYAKDAGIVIASDFTVQPVVASMQMGVPEAPFAAMAADKIHTDAVSSTGTLTLAALRYIISVSNLATGSSNLPKGTLWQSGGAIKVKTV
jgi:hypothetical protein